MTFGQKLYKLRRQQGLSQEELADRLEVSRQAVSRWEMGSTLPDAKNLLQLSELFQVSIDYLLRDEMEEEQPFQQQSFQQFDSPAPKQDPFHSERNRQIGLSILVALQILPLFMGIIGSFILTNDIAAVMSAMLSLLNIAVFEISLRICAPDERGRFYHRKYYRITVWLFAYFPLQFILQIPMSFLPWPIPGFVPEAVTLFLYLIVCITVDLLLREKKPKQ